MKIRLANHKSKAAGSALMLTMIMSALALAILASVMAWSSSSFKVTHSSMQYTRSVAAAEAATEKVKSMITYDFLFGGEAQVINNLNTYRQNSVPSTADSSYWSTWIFNDGTGHNGQTYVQRPSATSYIVMGSGSATLKGYVSTYTVVSHASDTASSQDVMGGVYQELQLVGIPIFQFAMYSSGDMEISCGQPFNVTGRVHANQTLYVEPDNLLTFESTVTAVVDILNQRDPLDTRGTPQVPVYEVPPEKVTALTLPIGTSNSPEAIREIIEPPPTGEDPNSPLGQLRYYNQSDLVIAVTNTGITAKSGHDLNGSATTIPATDLPSFVSTNASFWDAREGKMVQPIDIDIGNLKTWSETNNTLRTALGGNSLSSVYVWDQRNLSPSSLGAVRVVNGLQLPVNGLTVATARPLYVQGNYNDSTANLQTADTSATRPASLVGDAITVLSTAWSDPNQQGANLNTAGATTINAAFLTGAVETTAGQYSGGMENFPRFLESWGLGNVFTYNGSMVKMFPSLYATNVWEGINYKNHYYDPPKRNWTYDVNFDDPTKLPPRTPQLQKVITGRWATVPPDSNVPATP